MSRGSPVLTTPFSKSIAVPFALSLTLQEHDSCAIFCGANRVTPHLLHIRVTRDLTLCRSSFGILQPAARTALFFWEHSVATFTLPLRQGVKTRTHRLARANKSGRHLQVSRGKAASARQQPSTDESRRIYIRSRGISYESSPPFKCLGREARTRKSSQYRFSEVPTLNLLTTNELRASSEIGHEARSKVHQQLIVSEAAPSSCSSQSGPLIRYSTRTQRSRTDSTKRRLPALAPSNLARLSAIRPRTQQRLSFEGVQRDRLDRPTIIQFRAKGS